MLELGSITKLPSSEKLELEMFGTRLSFVLKSLKKKLELGSEPISDCSNSLVQNLKKFELAQLGKFAARANTNLH